METIKEAKQYLRDNFEKGCVCPVCAQSCKLYRRKITSAMSQVLIMLHDNHEIGEYIHVESFLKEKNCPSSLRGDFPKLKWFGLIEGQTGKREDGSKRNGYYRVTELGRQFVWGRATVPSYVLIYNDKCQGVSKEQVNIIQTFKNPFKYSELMLPIKASLKTEHVLDYHGL